MASIIRITKEFTFETGHALHGYDGLCKNVHGHSYKLSVTVKGTPINDPMHVKNGMVIDFSDLKKIVKEVYGVSFDNPKIKHLGGIYNDDLKPSFENKSYKDWLYLKNQFNITSLIVPKEWQIQLKIFLSNSKT